MTRVALYHKLARCYVPAGAMTRVALYHKLARCYVPAGAMTHVALYHKQSSSRSRGATFSKLLRKI